MRLRRYPPIRASSTSRPFSRWSRRSRWGYRHADTRRARAEALTGSNSKRPPCQTMASVRGGIVNDQVSDRVALPEHLQRFSPHAFCDCCICTVLQPTGLDIEYARSLSNHLPGGTAGFERTVRKFTGCERYPGTSTVVRCVASIGPTDRQLSMTRDAMSLPATDA